MKKNYINNWAFTLIELVVSMTIFSLIIVSIVLIYTSSINISHKIDISRIMQENIKNSISLITEDIRKNWIAWVSNNILNDCDKIPDDLFYKQWNKLCINNGNKYYLAKKDNILKKYIRVDSLFCKSNENQCYIIKNTNIPITNNMVSITDLSFNLSDTIIPKVTIKITLRVANKVWIPRWLVKDTIIEYQTTISQKLF
jgi:type II secretory pathway pseudopilin PulG